MAVTTLDEIERAIAKLPYNEIAELSRRITELEARLWDEKIAADARSGKLDSLISQAKAEYEAGRCREL